MPKVSPKDIEDLGFVAESFDRAEDFKAFLTAIIAEQGALLSARIGSTAYATADAVMAVLVKRAEKSLVAAELLQRRFVKISSDVSASDGNDAFKLRKTRDEYLAEAESLITRISAGVSQDGGGYAGGVCTTAHNGTLEWPA